MCLKMFDITVDVLLLERTSATYSLKTPIENEDTDVLKQGKEGQGHDPDDGERQDNILKSDSSKTTTV